MNDLVKLVTRLESASQTITNLPTELGLQVQQSLQAGSQFLQNELQQRMQQTLAPTQTRLQSLAHDCALYARLAHHSARRIHTGRHGLWRDSRCLGWCAGRGGPGTLSELTGTRSKR